jgi:hypothetical protein
MTVPGYERPISAWLHHDRDTAQTGHSIMLRPLGAAERTRLWTGPVGRSWPAPVLAVRTVASQRRPTGRLHSRPWRAHTVLPHASTAGTGGTHLRIKREQPGMPSWVFHTNVVQPIGHSDDRCLRSGDRHYGMSASSCLTHVHRAPLVGVHSIRAGSLVRGTGCGTLTQEGEAWLWFKKRRNMKVSAAIDSIQKRDIVQPKFQPGGTG